MSARNRFPCCRIRGAGGSVVHGLARRGSRHIPTRNSAATPGSVCGGSRPYAASTRPIRSGLLLSNRKRPPRTRLIAVREGAAGSGGGNTFRWWPSPPRIAPARSIEGSRFDRTGFAISGWHRRCGAARKRLRRNAVASDHRRATCNSTRGTHPHAHSTHRRRYSTRPPLMLKIQVTHSYFLHYDPKQWERGKPYPPLATIQVAAVLRRMGHDVALFDAMLADGVEAYEASVSSAAPDVVVLYEDNFNFLTKMCLERMREAACRMIAVARARGARVIVAGSDASDHPESFLAAGADVVLAGEGIAALVQLVRRLDSNRDIDTQGWVAGVSGVSFMEGGESRTARVGVQPPDAQLTGLPAWDLIDIERYRTLWLKRHGYFSLNMTASRGCPFHCNWCAKPIWGNHYRRRGAGEVA